MILAAVLLPALLGAEGDVAWQVRPHAGVGLTTAGSFGRREGIAWGVGGHAGVRLLHPWGPLAAGVETTVLTTGLPGGSGPRRLDHGGVVAEWRIEEFAHLSVGAGPYHLVEPAGVDDAHRRYALGGHLTMGLEPASWLPRWTPLLAYRSDVVMTRSVLSVRSGSLGLRWSF